MLEDTTEVRIKRSEQDIEALRKTQNRLLDRYDGIYKALVETRDIADENRQRLDSIENRQMQMEDRQIQMEDRLKRMEDRQKRIEDRQDSTERVLLECIAAIRENRQILLSIAGSIGLTIEIPGSED
ncbi:MAG: hypothetical protein OXG53_00035 [Chloroflexi bacterium]|nr:hypothetical protein [Chloroflexota bacterium]